LSGWIFVDKSKGIDMPLLGVKNVFTFLLIFSSTLLVRPCFATPQLILPAPATNLFNFQTVLFGQLQSLNLNIVSVNSTSGMVTINGGDTRQPGTPFSWQWGDGSTTSGFFPQTHTYSNTTSNYVVTVTAFYSGGTTGTCQTVVWFAPPSIHPVTLPPDTTVTVATSPQTLASRNGYGFSPTLTNFNTTSFGIISQTNIQYILTAAAAMERDFVNENYVLVNGQFQEVVMCDPSVAGYYTLWYASPVAFSGGNTNALAASIPWAFYFNEMGKNFTLNSPSNYCFGGKIDGDANAIISESFGGIFEIATAYELLNHGTELGLNSDLVADVNNSAITAASIVRANYNDYTNTGSVFHSWNNGTVNPDVTIDTFSTISYKFLQHAEQSGQGYRVPLKRLMQALELFNSSWSNSFSPSIDTPAADSFRATLWVAALSYAFQTDLRNEFETLNFPVSDTTYTNLSTQMAALPDIINTPYQLNIQSLPSFGPTLSINGQIPRFYTIQAVTNLSTHNWTNIGNVFNTATNSLWRDSSASNIMRFYRSKLLP
jgi:hypothetical protein